MSGAEVIAVIGAISAIADLIDKSRKIYAAAKNKIGLPDALQQVAEQLPIVEDILKELLQAADRQSDAVSNEVKKATDACLQRAKKLREIFEEVIPGEEAKRRERYVKAVKAIGKQGKVEELMKGVMKNLEVLGSNFNLKSHIQTAELLAKLVTGLKDIEAIPMSVDDDEFRKSAYQNEVTGGGSMYSHQGVGNMNNGPGAGGTFNGAVTFVDNHHATSDQIYKECLYDLRARDPRSDKRRIESSKDDLLEGSCSWVLNDTAFQTWWTQDNPHLLWIHGDPGKGKTMMMLSLYSEVSKRIKATASGAVVSYFFCQSTDDQLNNAVAVLRGLIFLLVCQDKPALLLHLRESLDETRGLEGSLNLLHALFRILIDLSLRSKFSKVYLMIDALDECNFDMLPLLWEITKSASDSQKIKWLVTSRNETLIKEALHSRDRPCVSLELNSEHVSRAVGQFVQAKVARLAEIKRYTSQLKADVEEYLSEQAEGTFLWVALVCKELEGVRKLDTMDRLRKFPPKLEPLYQRILDQLSASAGQEHSERHLQVLRLITIALRPLRIEEIVALGDLLPGREYDLQDSKDLVDICGSFLTIREDIVYFVHHSATDFFKTGGGSTIFTDGESYGHALIANRCLDLMHSTLKRDVCKLATPDASPQGLEDKRVEQHLQSFVQYSVQYWVEHLHRSWISRKDWLNNKAKVLRFIQTFFLYWLEALSLIRRSAVAVHLIDLLEQPTLLNTTEPLGAFISDAHQFILRYRSIIELVPLQLYSSALVFSPQASVVRKQFSNRGAKWISKWPVVAENWGALQSTLEGHSDWVRGAAFSPDGQVVASASADKTVRLWSTQTGALQSTLEGHSDQVNAVAFSPDGHVVASASADTTIRLWSTQTGALQSTLKGHFDYVNAVAFSPDGQVVASASDDKTVRLWSTQTCTLQNILEGHSGQVRTIVFSPDGQVVASVSYDMTVRLWSPQTGDLQSILEGHSDQVNAIAFSNDSQAIASASYDMTVQLWSLQTNALQNILVGHSGSINAVAFSPDGRVVASASYDETLRLWSAETGDLQSILVGHSGSINAVAFSPDGQVVASASYDKTVRLWNLQTGTLQSTLEGHSSAINTIAFSPDGRIIASVSFDSTVRLWSTQASALQRTPKGHSDQVNAIAFSPDGQVVASASSDKTVRLWSIQTGALQSTFEGHSDQVNAVAFSPDGQVVASASNDKTVRLWSMQTGALQRTLEGHSDQVRTIVFSPDGQVVASVSYDMTVRLWSTQTGTLQSKLHSHSIAVAFSPDGQVVASASYDMIVQLWSPQTGALQRTLKGHSDHVNAVAFSPDGQVVASASDDKTVRLWSTQTGALQSTLERQGSIQHLSFGTDGSYLCTNLGVINLQIPPDGICSTRQPSLDYSLSQDKCWIVWRKKKVLWLPSEYRPTCSGFQGNILVMGHASGRITFMPLKDCTNIARFCEA